MEKIKHEQFILAVEKKAFDDIDGYVDMDPEELRTRVTGALIVARRHELETDERFLQFIPYVVLYRMVDNEAQVYTYRRAAGSGEDRLLGLGSIGVGGHIEVKDIPFKNSSMVDFNKTVANAIERELEEEVYFEDGEGVRISDFHVVRTLFGVIQDKSNEVGRVHVGLVYAVKVPSYVTVLSKESDMQNVGMLDLDGLLKVGNRYGFELENWSERLLSLVPDLTLLGRILK